MVKMLVLARCIPLMWQSSLRQMPMHYISSSARDEVIMMRMRMRWSWKREKESMLWGKDGIIIIIISWLHHTIFLCKAKWNSIQIFISNLKCVIQWQLINKNLLKNYLITSTRNIVNLSRVRLMTFFLRGGAAQQTSHERTLLKFSKLVGVNKLSLYSVKKK